jgi:phenylalanine-4-hydroxylase
MSPGGVGCASAACRRNGRVTPYVAAGYQPVLNSARSLDHVADALHDFLDEFDEDTRDRLGLPAPAERGAVT